MTVALTGLTVVGVGGSTGAAVTPAVVTPGVVAPGVVAPGVVAPGVLAPGVLKPGVVTVAGSLAPFTAHTRVTGDVPASERLTIQLWLQPDTAAATRFATAVTTPGRSGFHRYLIPDSYAARFGATRSAVGEVESWLRSEGFTAIRADRERSYVQASAATSTISSAFDVQLKLYRSSAAVNAGRYALRSNDRPLSLPASLSRVVSGVTGLDNAAPSEPVVSSGVGAGREAAATSAPCSNYYGQHQVGGLPARFGRTTFPTEVCGYSAKQMRAAYGADMTNTGKGQTIALIEDGLEPDMFRTLRDWAAFSGLPAPSSTRYAELSVGKPCTDASDVRAQPGLPPDIEEQMDVEAAYAMAPGANELVVTGVSCGGANPEIQGLLDADLAVVDGSGHHPLASVTSNSWVGGGESQPASLTTIEHDYLLQAAAEGVGMYFASGDTSGIETPASDPYATAVGGTTLGLRKTGARLFETGWSTRVLQARKGVWEDEGEFGAAGGGPSVRWKQPWYQRGVVPAALSRDPGSSGRFRSVPDISADADPGTAMAVGALDVEPGEKPRFFLTSGGGTSQSTPLVAGMVVAAEQNSVPFGFLNPVLYELAGTRALHDIRSLTTSSPSLYRASACDKANCNPRELTVFDVHSTSASEGFTGQVTLKGYDNMTGVGTPDGQRFIEALRALAR